MSINVSVIPTSPVTASSHAKRSSSATFPPAIWTNCFSSSVCEVTNNSIQEEIDGLKQQVRKMLTCTNEPSHKLHLINTIQRLGIAYHFEREIDDNLQQMSDDHWSDKYDLHTTSVWFRLLRQQGIKVSSDAFQKFKDSKGDFKESLVEDVEGMLSMYEASFLGIRGEDILDEALDFTTKNLQSKLSQLNSHLAEQVKHALNRPIRKCLPRLSARHYITVYSREHSHDGTLLKLAVLDFNTLQQLHQKELNDAIEWWKSLNVETNFPYARDRAVECYFWMMGLYFEPQYSLGRKIQTKVIAMTSIIDDTYDNYGTYEDLYLLTQAIQRWDIKAKDELPKNMKLVYSTLLDLYNEIEEDMAKEEMLHAIPYAKAMMKSVAKNYLVETKWRDEGYIPTMEEYMKVSPVSSAYPMLATTSFLGMGALATKDVFEWVTADPKMTRASAIVCRLMDDIVSHQFEQTTRKHVASAVECYIKEYDASEKEVVELFKKEVANAWKDMNEECLNPTPVPLALLERVLNLARAIDVIYKDDDKYTNPHLLKDYIASVLKDPILV